MNLIWKLLRQHISTPQLVGFFFANLFGMFIVLLGFQFYRDVLPVFVAQDSFMKPDFMIIHKKIGTSNALSGRNNYFSDGEYKELSSQSFAKNIGKFTTSEYKVEARMGINGVSVLNSEISFESVPNEFVNVSENNWHYQQGDKIVPIILPRSYITMYNFGFAQNHSLPKISEGLIGMIDFNIFIHGNSHSDQFKGKVIGFSNRMNTILVPQDFMDWANAYYAPNEKGEMSRLIMKVANPTDVKIKSFIDHKGYEFEEDNMNVEKTTYFLRMIVLLVISIGIVISILSFYILMLSIYLIVQKNSAKLENLLLIGYSPNKVALPYQLLTISVNFLTLLIAWVILFFVRNYYMNILTNLFPELDDGSMLEAIILGTLLFLLVTMLNIVAIRRKLIRIWFRKD